MPIDAPLFVDSRQERSTARPIQVEGSSAQKAPSVIARSITEVLSSRRARSLVLAAIVLAGCGTPSGANGGGTSSVQWKDYAANLQAQLDASANAKDCAALQKQFNAADANSQATVSRTGHNNADLMAYIDGKMRGAGCY